MNKPNRKLFKRARDSEGFIHYRAVSPQTSATFCGMGEWMKDTKADCNCRTCLGMVEAVVNALNCKP